ncbi:nuclear pore complex protein DDB_G0274915-like isoform X2 [Armigeres subalbatus]|uniref:nuclear pore complex protein DDB_G0274915-like isoform X2 n=1 Tax=Armigeres subalbatus TaxID=124917 RepID=UPI002ED1F75F
MKKFITTKLRAVVSDSVQEQTLEVENDDDDDEEEEHKEEEDIAKNHVGGAGSGIVGLQSAAAAAAPSLSSSPTTSVMTLNSSTSKHHQQRKQQSCSSGGGSINDNNNSNNNYTTGMMTVEVPPGGSPKLVQQKPQTHQHGIITIGRPQPPKAISTAVTTTTSSVVGQQKSGGSLAKPATATTTAGQVKMCGYLKKKRNKMGGWRKMYFILQNQLLLSYSSKDDYEKKLAPFKDIINLVPGTVIIPTTGPRFTIETNSKVLYTFRCDDHKSCSEWITALLDSLKGEGGVDKKFSSSSHHALHGARNGNLHHHLTRRSLSSLSSSSSSTSSTSTSAYATDDPSKMAITSIRRLQQTSNLLHPASQPSQQRQQQQTSLSAPNLFYGFGSNGSASATANGATVTSAIISSNSSNVKMGKLVQLPIAGGTARLLERGGGGAATAGINGQKMYKILTINEDEDDGENDEKPIPAPAAAASNPTSTARGFSNGSASRGDPSSTGIKGTTALAPPPSTAEETPAKNAVKIRPTTTTAVAAVTVKVGEKPLKEPLGKATAPAGWRGADDELFNSNFRLHTNLGRMHQSVDVCRINSMFGGGKQLASSSSLLSSVAPGKRLNNNEVDSKTVTIIGDSSSNSLAASTGDLRTINRTIIAKGNGNGNVIYNNLRGTRAGSATDLRRNPRMDLVEVGSTMMDPKPLKDINHNNLSKWSAESITIELTANGYNLTGTGIKSVGSTDTLYQRKLNATTQTGSRSVVESRNLSRSNSHSSSSHPPMSLSPFSSASSSQQKSHGGQFSSKIDIYRTGSSPEAQPAVHLNSVKRNHYEEIGSGTTPKQGSLMVEPIYAVVDLKVKKARRLNQRKEPDSLGSVDDGTEDDEHSIKVDMVRDTETGRLKEKSRSTNLLPIGASNFVGSNDYEELNELIVESFVNFGDDPDDSNDGENIYEPINIPEGPLTLSSSSLPSGQSTTSSSQMNNLWRNLKKMNLNHLIKRSGMQDQPNQRPAVAAADDDESTAKPSTAFSEFSKKFGHHRRSIKNKMRGLYERGQSVEAPAKVGSQPDEKQQLRVKGAAESRQHMFGSTFGRNKKSRKSLSFDDFIPRKKQHHHLNGVGVICKSDKANNEKLHKELKRQLSKRSTSSSGGESSLNDGKKGGIEL